MMALIEPANRFEMDSLIAEAVSRNEPALIYYWQLNALLAQLDLRALEMGAFDSEAAKCLAQKVCAAPRPSAFPPETVLVALREWVLTDIPAIAGYFQRTSLPLGEMNALLARLGWRGGTVIHCSPFAGVWTAVSHRCHKMPLVLSFNIEYWSNLLEYNNIFRVFYRLFMSGVQECSARHYRVGPDYCYAPRSRALQDY